MDFCRCCGVRADTTSLATTAAANGPASSTRYVHEQLPISGVQRPAVPRRTAMIVKVSTKYATTTVIRDQQEEYRLCM